MNFCGFDHSNDFHCLFRNCYRADDHRQNCHHFPYHIVKKNNYHHLYSFFYFFLIEDHPVDLIGSLFPGWPTQIPCGTNGFLNFACPACNHLHHHRHLLFSLIYLHIHHLHNHRCIPPALHHNHHLLHIHHCHGVNLYYDHHNRHHSCGGFVHPVPLH